MNIKTYKNCYKLKKGLRLKSEDLLLFALKNERISFQVLIISDGERIEISDFRLDGTFSDKFDFTVFAMEYLNCKDIPNQLIDSGIYPDAILPFSVAKANGKNTVDCNDERGFLICITPNGKADAETYDLNLKIVSNINEANVPLTVEVFDTVMPSENHCRTLFNIFKDGGWLGDNEEERSDTYRKYYEMLADYRLSGAFLPTENTVIDKASVDDVVKTAEIYACDERISCYSLNYQIVYRDVDGKKVAEFDCAYFKELLVALCNNSTNENNLLKKCVLYPGSYIDEPTPDKHNKVRKLYDDVYRIKREIAEEIDFSSKREVEASLLTFDVIITMWNKEGVYGGVDTFCPQYEAFSYPEYLYESSKLKQLGTKEWFYGCMGPQNPYPNYLIYDKLHQIKIVNWLMFHYNVGGNLYFAVNLTYNSGRYYKRYINILEDKNFTSAKINGKTVSYYGDGCLIYNEIFYGEFVPSLRLNAIMEGNEDYEKLLLYKNAVDTLSKKYCIDFNCKNILRPYLEKLFDGSAVTNHEEHLLDAEYMLNNLLELALKGVYLERNIINGIVEITVYSGKDTKLSSKHERIGYIEKQHFNISKYKIVPNEINNYFNFCIDGKVYSIYASDLLIEIDKNMLAINGNKITLNDYNDSKLIETKAFVNTEKEEVQLVYNMNFNAEKLDRFYIDITSLCDYSFCIAVDLIDEENKVFELGYDVIEERTRKTISLKKQLRLIKRLNDYLGYDRAYECKQTYLEHFKINFHKIKCVKFTIINNLKLLDNNRERRLVDYKFLINDIYYSETNEIDI